MGDQHSKPSDRSASDRQPQRFAYVTVYAWSDDPTADEDLLHRILASDGDRTAPGRLTDLPERTVLTRLVDSIVKDHLGSGAFASDLVIHRVTSVEISFIIWITQAVVRYGAFRAGMDYVLSDVRRLVDLLVLPIPCQVRTGWIDCTAIESEGSSDRNRTLSLVNRRQLQSSHSVMMLLTNLILIVFVLLLLWRFSSRLLSTETGTRFQSPLAVGNAPTPQDMPPTSSGTILHESNLGGSSGLPPRRVPAGDLNDRLAVHRQRLSQAEAILRASHASDEEGEWISTLVAHYYQSWPATSTRPPIPDDRLAGTSPINLSGAILDNVDLSHQDLRLVDFTNASLRGCDLSGADLRGANLRHADLTGATLINTDLRYTVMRPVRMTDADVRGAIFVPQTLVYATDIGLARNLDRLTYTRSPVALKMLQQSLLDAGMVAQARDVAAAARRHDASLFELVLFDVTCGFGSRPLKPLVWLGALWFMGSLIYGARCAHSSGLHWFWPISRWPQHQRTVGIFLRSTLLSTRAVFMLGVGDFRLREAMRLVLPSPKRKDLADPVIRTVSGLQSLLSVALIILSIACYFQSPFLI